MSTDSRALKVVLALLPVVGAPVIALLPAFGRQQALREVDLVLKLREADLCEGAGLVTDSLVGRIKRQSRLRTRFLPVATVVVMALSVLVVVLLNTGHAVGADYLLTANSVLGALIFGPVLWRASASLDKAAEDAEAGTK